MRKIYNCPATEVITVNAAYGLCQMVSKFGLDYGGATDIVDPISGGL